MDVSQFEMLATLRAVIGYLGEREQQNLWPSSFFSSSSRTFLSPVFARTTMLAQCSGVTRAAALVHDERIGTGSVFHLFRLPEDIEQGIHRVLHDPKVVAEITMLVGNREAALAYLRERAGPSANHGVGPTHIGDTHALRDDRSWALVAEHYRAGFETRAEVYPYFRDRA